jgi:3-hydroxybutyrate dehydrogenase
MLQLPGASLVLNGFGTKDHIENLRKSLNKEFDVPVTYEGADMSKVGEIEDMMGQLNKIGGVDILCNNAGIQHVSPIETFGTVNWDRVLAINLSSVFHTTRLALPIMKEKGFGRVVNIASVHGMVGSPDKSAYVAAKHGVIGLTKVTALETAKYANITANAICPGWVLTPLVEAQLEKRAKENGTTYDTEKTALLTEKQPSPEFVTPSQLGDLCVFLCSDSATGVRGVAWQMDGAWTAQ